MVISQTACTPASENEVVNKKSYCCPVEDGVVNIKKVTAAKSLTYSSLLNHSHTAAKPVWTGEQLFF
jgi:hypothetical protein